MMPSRFAALVILNVFLIYPINAMAESLNTHVESQHRAKFNYQISCQGCHVADGIGRKSVPTLRNSMHRFMQTASGRKYLVQVPGSANSALSDEALTEVLNWMLVEFTQELKGVSWRPFNVSEVSGYRQTPLLETIKARKKIVDNFN